jgi:pyrimidine-nucleoside phosphorylase
MTSNDPARAAPLVTAKRQGREFPSDDIGELVAAWMRDEASDAEVAALTTAGTTLGFSAEEVGALTRALVASGATVELTELEAPTVGKHGTGGVGDPTTLLLAPLIAAAGGAMVKLSGRGLAHTGGTIDALEAAEGVDTELTPGALRRIAGDVGAVVGAPTERLVPAVRRLQWLRARTGTVDSPPLVAASIVAQQLATGVSTVVFDVKAGPGGFITDVDAAEALGELAVTVGNEAGRRCSGVVTAMDQPLGHAVGPALELTEACELLAAEPAGRCAQLVLELGARAWAEAKAQHGGSDSRDEARNELDQAWRSGRAGEQLGRMLAAQGGNATVCERPREALPQAPVTRQALATQGGVVTGLAPRQLGELVAGLGGRSSPGDPVDPSLGVELLVELGDAVEAGTPLATVHAPDREQAQNAVTRLGELVTFGDGQRPVAQTPVLRTIDLG